MSLISQIASLLESRAMSIADLGRLMGITPLIVSETLEAKYDALESTLEGLATGLDAEWVLVPKEFLPEIRRVLDGKGTGPDYAAPSAVELFLTTRKA